VFGSPGGVATVVTIVVMGRTKTEQCAVSSGFNFYRSHSLKYFLTTDGYLTVNKTEIAHNVGSYSASLDDAIVKDHSIFLAQ